MAIKINLMPSKEDAIAKQEQKKPSSLVAILVLAVLSTVVYLGIYSYNTFFLGKQLDAVKGQNAGIQNEIVKSATSEVFLNIITAVTKGKSIQSILSTHLYTSKIYELLEKITIKSVVYNGFSEKINDDKTVNASISGEADSFNALAKQLLVFKKSKEIKEIMFEEASIGKNEKVSFTAILIFDLNLITTRPVITLINSSLIDVTVGSSYSDAGAIAVDGVDGQLVVTTKGLVNTSVAGTYTILYSAINTAGNSAIVTRTVNVVASKPQ